MMKNLKVNDKVKVRIYGTDGKAIKTRNFDEVFTVCEENGKLGIYWTEEFAPFETFCNTEFLKQIETLEIVGKRWFQKSYGNTYHSVTVLVNDEELKSDITYGYGNHYLTTAAELLKANGYDIPSDNGEAFALMMKYDHSVRDVKRMKDL
jgi:hypothetical protein